MASLSTHVWPGNVAARTADAAFNWVDHLHIEMPFCACLTTLSWRVRSAVLVKYLTTIEYTSYWTPLCQPLHPSADHRVYAKA